MPEDMAISISKSEDSVMKETPPEASDHALPRVLMTIVFFAMAAFFAYMLYVSPSDTVVLAFCLLGSGVLAVLWPFAAKIDLLKFGTSGTS
ncbi:hypothetical protein GOL88_28735 [Sinorhizobium medicae]|nr:hypothetical protein [Sinorhizobium medicae]